MITKGQKIKFLKFVVTALVLGVVLTFTAVGQKIENTRIYYFSVGQGNATLIRLPDETDILIDGGPNNQVVEQLGRAMPFFDRTIEYLVVTHPDLDHFFGLNKVLQDYEVKNIIINGLSRDNQIYRQFEAAVAAENANVIIPDRELKIIFGNGSNLEISNSFKTFGEDEKNSNGSSLIVRFVQGEFESLFPGDIEAKDEKKILEQDWILSADVLLSPHHGSKTSSTEKFLQAVQPELIIISAGLKNKHGHPHQQTLDRYQSMEIPFLRTDFEGTIILETDGQKYWRRP